MLDSTLLVDFLQRKEESRRVIARMEGEGARHFTTEVNAFELLVAAYAGGKLDPRRLAKTVGLLGRLHVLPLDRAGALEAAEISGKLRAAGRTVGVLDILTAGIARASGCDSIVTRDQDFCRIPGIRMETY